VYLRSIQIENYRAIRRGTVTFDGTTVIIGENDSGRTSIIEALMLLLGAPEQRFERRLRCMHFHRGTDDRIAGPLRVRLFFREDTAGVWNPPDGILPSLTRRRDSRRQFEFTFEAALDPASGTIEPVWFLADENRSRTEPPNRPGLLEWVRQLVPALWLRTGLAWAPETTTIVKPRQDADLAALELHYRRVVTGEVTDVMAELEQGAQVARVVIERYRGLFAGTATILGAMASDILKRPRAARHAEPQGESAAQKIGMLLLLGALLQLIDREMRPEGRPLLVIENPESNLHPMTVASVWRLIERISWQKVITTNSGSLLAQAPLSAIRRLTRNCGIVRQWHVPPGFLSGDDLRRLAYHVRSRRASAMFARCWLLVEGETEFWVLPELARVLGYDFGAEGIVPVEFAQCGLSPLIRLARQLGISWVVLADGDDAGNRYAAAAQALMPKADGFRIAQLPQRDIELCFWHHGFDGVIRRIAFPGTGNVNCPPKAAIQKAIDRTSKPFLALSLIEAAAERGPESIPPVLRQVIEKCADLARTTPALPA
jgi:putative ATP-dependent endonuclease of OLD family